MVIYTNAKGVPFDKPMREEFAVGTDGARAFEFAYYAYKNAISDCGNSAFDAAFRKAMRAVFRP
ncbi:MAG: hypothetical protein L3J47_00085 [Sulfurovum sp.]|nr:hypothetical protein [Sulfurovum sp.]